MFKPHKALCSACGKDRLLVVKKLLCKQCNEERKGKNNRPRGQDTKRPSAGRRIYDPSKVTGYKNNREPDQNKWKHSSGIAISKRILKKQSVKRRKQNIAYLALRKIYLETHPICQANIQGVCSGEQTHEIHHTHSGKDRGKYFLDITTWLAVERCCHDWIHLHPIEAREMGLLK